MADIFPQRNLPGRAETWGRAVEGGIISLEKARDQVASREGNWSRGSAGRLAVLSRNLDEIANRSAVSLALPNMSVTGSAISEPYPRAESTFSFPATPGVRDARIMLTGSVDESTYTQSRLYVYLIYRGAIVGSYMVQPSAPASTPTEWLNDGPLYVFGTIQTQDNLPTDITVRIVRGADAFTPGTSTMTLQNAVLTLVKSGVS